MGNQPNGFVEIRRRADLRAVLAHFGLKPIGKGDQVKIRCPCRDDAEPSCSVNLANGLFHCFPALWLATRPTSCAGRRRRSVGRPRRCAGRASCSPGSAGGRGVPMATMAKLAKAARKAVERRIRARRHRPAPRRLLRLLRLLEAVERVFRAKERKPGPASRSASRSRSILGTRA